MTKMLYLLFYFLIHFFPMITHFSAAKYYVVVNIVYYRGYFQIFSEVFLCVINDYRKIQKKKTVNKYFRLNQLWLFLMYYNIGATI